MENEKISPFQQTPEPMAPSPTPQPSPPLSPPPPTTYYPQPSGKSKKYIIKIVVGIILVLMIGIGAALATRIWDPLWNPFRPSPQQVIDKMIGEMANLKTAHSRAKINITGKEDSQKVFALSMDLENDMDNTLAEKPKSAGDFYVALAFEGMQFSLAGESKTIEDVSYFKLTTIPAFPFLEPFFQMVGFDINQFKNQWIKIDPEEFVKEMMAITGVPITPEMEAEMQQTKEQRAEIIKELQNILKGKKLYIIKKEFPDTEIAGKKTYHYLVALNKESLKEVLPELYRVLVVSMKFGPEPTEEQWQEFREQMSNAIDEFFAKIGDVTAELWIGKKDYFLYKIEMGKTIDLSKLAERRGPSAPLPGMGSPEGIIDISLNIDFSKFNEPVKIEAPAEYKTLEEIFSIPSFFESSPYYPSVPETFVPEGINVKEYEIFSQEVAYRGESVGQSGRLPIKHLFIPQETKIYNIEGYLKAFNRDPTYPRSIGIAIGSSIPDDCKAGYYLTLGSGETKERFFTLDTDLFRPGNNLVTTWVSTYGEWGGIESWVTLKLKIYYSGEAPQILEGISILSEPIDPISCRLK